MGSTSIDLLYLVSNAGPMVLLVLLLLFFFSIATWAIIFIKYRYIKRVFRESALFTDYFWRSRDLSDAFAQAKQLQHSPIARVFRVGYMELKKIKGTNPSASADELQPNGEPSLRTRFRNSASLQANWPS